MHNKVFCFIKQFSSLFIRECAEDGNFFLFFMLTLLQLVQSEGSFPLSHFLFYLLTPSAGANGFLKKDSFIFPQSERVLSTDGTS